LLVHVHLLRSGQCVRPAAAWRARRGLFPCKLGRFIAIEPHPSDAFHSCSQTTWQRFFDPGEPMFALVAEVQGEVVGLAHALFHRSMTRIEPVCYLSDLYTLESKRGRGIGRLLIEAVYDQAKAAGASRVYWQTHESNAAGRLLYDKLAKHLGFIVYTKEL
jgi:GNAT superfamily N-acetyltransferase